MSALVFVLLLLAFALMFRPGIAIGSDAASIAGYLAFPTDHTAITSGLEDIRPETDANSHIGWPVLQAILYIASLIMMLVLRRRTSALILPIVTSISGIIISQTSLLFELSGVAPITTVLLIGVLALSILAGDWRGSANVEWKTDPRSARLIRSIEHAGAKKKLTVLTDYLSSTDPAVRIAAIRALGKTGENAAFQPLVIQLNCPHSDVRMAAAEALADLGDTRGRTYLMHFMDTDPDMQVRSAMRSALGRLPSIAV